MNNREFKKAYYQATYDKKSSSIFFVECSLIALIIGIYFKSWAWGLGSYIGVIILLQIKAIQFLLAIGFIILWTIIGWAIGKNFGIIPSILGGILMFIISLGVHFAALSWIEDFSGR